MALTEDRARSIQAAISGRSSVSDGETVASQPRAHAPATIGNTPVPMSAGCARVLAGAWLIGLPLTFILEPAPTSTSADPLWAIVAGNLLLGAIALTFVGSWLRRGWAGRASLVGSLILVTAVIACPVTGHHTVGVWWVAQLAVAVALLAVSGVAALRPSA